MAQAEAKLLHPGLAGFYQKMAPVAETFVRVIVGIMFLMHVSGKFKPARTPSLQTSSPRTASNRP
jgi:hypothetical protein